MSDNELDAELLALAGGDGSSSEEEDTKPTSPRKRSSSREFEDKSPPRRGVASKLKSRANIKKSRMADSDEEGEASETSSRKSLGSAAMDESGSETSPNDLDDDAPLYPIEGKFSSERDRADIMNMTEIQREEILAERAAEVQRRAQDQQLKRLLQQRKQTESSDKKRKAGAADLDDNQRKSSRPKTKASESLEAYKRQRELKGAQRARGEERRRDKSPSRDRDLSDEDADGEDEVEWDDVKRKSPAREAPPPDLRDFDLIKVGRINFAKVCFYPTFESSIKGCYCRVNVGMESGHAYRMVQIKGFKEGRPYAMEGLNGKKLHTDQYVVCSQGKKEKEYPFQACSEGRITESEFAEFKKALDADSLRFPTRKQTKAKLDDIHALLDHQWTEADIQKKVDKTAAMKKKFFNYGRDRIIRRRDDAASRGDDVVVAKCNQELAAYDGGNPSSGGKASTPNKRDQQQERLALLNKQNRKINSEEVRKAQLATKRAEQKAREEAIAKAKKREEEKAAAAKNGSLAVPDDLFGDASDISRAGTPGLSGAGTPRKAMSRAGTPLNGVKEKKLGQFRKKNMDDDVIASMDLGIDIDL